MPINQIPDDLRQWDKPEISPNDWDYRDWLSSRNIDETERLTRLIYIQRNHQYRYIDGLLVDAMTGGWLLQLYQALKPENQQKFISLDIGVMCDTMYKLANKGVITLGIGGS